MAVARWSPMRARDRRWSLPLLVSLVLSGCGGSDSPGGPDAGGNGDLLSVGGSYPTDVTLLPGGTCTGVVTQDAVTTVDHAAGGTSLTISHAGIAYAGTVDTAGNFQTTPKTVLVAPARYVISVTGHFTTSGLDATVTVAQTDPTSCSYTVQWVGTKSGSPNVIPG